MFALNTFKQCSGFVWNNPGTIIGSTCVIILAGEVSGRHYFPQSLLRPSVAITATASLTKTVFYSLGWMAGRVFDSIYLLHKYVPYQDVFNLLDAGCQLFGAPFEFFKGYWDHFAVCILQTCKDYAQSMNLNSETIVQYAFGTTAISVALLTAAALVGYYCWFGMS